MDAQADIVTPLPARGPLAARPAATVPAPGAQAPGPAAGVLVVHYSLSGTSRMLAHTLALRQGWDVAEVRDAVPGRGPWRCILDSLMRRCPPVLYTGPSPAAFEAVVLVFPIWAGRVAGPMRSFVSDWRDRLPRVAIAPTMDGDHAPGAVGELARLLGHPLLLVGEFRAAEVRDGRCAAAIDAFGAAVNATREPAGPRTAGAPMRQAA